MINATLNSVPCTPVIDEGSEINCVDFHLANKAAIPQVPTLCKAKAAGNMNMNIKGETAEDVKLLVSQNDSTITWNLGKCIVVQNLGVDILIGEPAKVDNKIVTIPHKKLIETNDDKGNKVFLQSMNKSHHERHLVRVTSSQTIFPGDPLNYSLPSSLSQE